MREGIGLAKPGREAGFGLGGLKEKANFPPSSPIGLE